MLSLEYEARSSANSHCATESSSSLTELPACRVEPAGNPFAARRNSASYDAGIRALYGQLRGCRTPQGDPIRAVGMTSCHPREGKTTIARALARVASEQHKTLLLKVGERAFDLHRAAEGFVPPRRFPHDEADLSAASCRPTEPASAVRDLVREGKQAFDLVIVDLPVVDGPGCLDWAAALDGVVLVLEAERVRWQAAARSLTLLKRCGVEVLGSVINKRRDYIPEFLYRRV